MGEERGEREKREESEGQREMRIKIEGLMVKTYH